MEAKLVMIVVEGRIELVCPVDPAPIDDHHDLFAGGAEGGHHLVDILAQLLGIKVRNDFIEDFGGAVLDRAQHTEQHAACDPAPGAIAPPGRALEGLVALDLALSADGWADEGAGHGATSPTWGGQSATGSFHLHRAK